MGAARSSGVLPGSARLGPLPGHRVPEHSSFSIRIAMVLNVSTSARVFRGACSCTTFVAESGRIIESGGKRFLENGRGEIEITYGDRDFW